VNLCKPHRPAIFRKVLSARRSVLADASSNLDFPEMQGHSGLSRKFLRNLGPNHTRYWNPLVTRHPDYVVDLPPVTSPRARSCSASWALRVHGEGRRSRRRARSSCFYGPRGVHQGRGARMRTRHHRGAAQEIGSRHSRLAREESAPGWLCTAYDEHPGAGVGNHSAGRNRRSMLDVSRGAQAEASGRRTTPCRAEPRGRHRTGARDTP
jgi:hypothetical protein